MIFRLEDFSMLYKGSSIVRPYKSLGNCDIMDYTGHTRAETIPWYSEQKVYKGNSLIYPCYTTANPSSHFTTSESFVSFFSQGNPGSISRCDESDFKYGSFKWNNVVTGGSHTDISTTQVGNVMIFNVDPDGSDPIIKVLKNPYSFFDPETEHIYVLMSLGTERHLSRSLTINNVNCRMQYTSPSVRVNFSSVLLTTNDITSMSCQLKVANDPADIEPTITSFTNMNSLVDGRIIATFNNVSLWYVECSTSLYELQQTGYTYIRPCVYFLDTSGNSAWHVQVVNMKLCAHLENYY